MAYTLSDWNILTNWVLKGKVLTDKGNKGQSFFSPFLPLFISET